MSVIQNKKYGNSTNNLPKHQ